MKHSDLRKEAAKNLQNSPSIKTFSLANYDFEKLNGWAIIGMFLLEAKNSLKICSQSKSFNGLNEMEELTLSSGMFKNFVLCYSKCFSSSGKNKVSLDANDIYSNRQDLKETHEKILETRNKYVAHNDDENGYDIAIAFTKEDEKEITLAQTYTSVIPYGDFKSFLNAAEHCEQQIIIKFNKKIDKLEKEIGKKISFK